MMLLHDHAASLAVVGGDGGRGEGAIGMMIRAMMREEMHEKVKAMMELMRMIWATMMIEVKVGVEAKQRAQPQLVGGMELHVAVMEGM